MTVRDDNSEATLSERTPKRAVVVGIDDYSGTPFDDLLLCGADANGMSHALESLGFEVVRLVDSAATKPAIVKALASEVGAQDLDCFVFFFAGHGCVTAVGGHLVTSDGLLHSEGVGLQELTQLLGRISEKGANVVAILDCCQAGAVQMEAGEMYSQALSNESLQHQFERSTGSKAVLAACLADEESEEDLAVGHGKFTNRLLEGLGGGAADHDGRITPSSLHSYVAPLLEKATGQTPAYYASIAGTVALGEGFPPSAKPASSSSDYAAIERRADELISDYRRRFSDHDPDTWQESGFQDAAKLLGQAISWMEKESARNVALLDRSGFKRTYENARRLSGVMGTLEPGTKLDQGVVQKVIGSGAFGTVWKIDGETEALAYKVYHASELSDTAKKSRFKHGFRAMDKLNHKRVVKVRGLTEVPTGFFMEFVDGPNLRDVNPSSVLDPQHSIRLMIEIAEAVAHAHERDVIHRDIKPENIVCAYDPATESWEPYLTDFDLAWTTTSSQVTRDGIGNYLYAAPEQLMYFTQKAVSGFYPTLDVFALGQLFYFCVTGSDPNPTHRDENRSNLQRALADWPSAEASRECSDLYALCTEEKPKDRLQTVDELLQRLFKAERAARPDALSGSLNANRVLEEVAFSFSGAPREMGDASSITFESLSGQSIVHLSYRESRSGQINVAAEIEPTVPIKLDGKSNDAIRRKLNQRVEDAIADMDDAAWHHGNRGAFSIFIDVNRVPKSGEGVSKIRSVLTTVLKVIEGAR